MHQRYHRHRARKRFAPPRKNPTLATRKEPSPKVDRKLKRVFREIGVPRAAPFKPDPFQLEATHKLHRGDVLVTAPTGSGKTWIAVQAIREILGQRKRAWYASPLKALSNSKYEELSREFGNPNVGILTGDRKENPEAPVIVGTTEILRNQLYDAMHTGEDLKADLVVLDEAHYLGDPDRGVVWEEVMIYLPQRVRLLLLSATIQNSEEVAAWLSTIRNKACDVVISEKRPVPLYPLFLLPDGTVTPLSGMDGLSPRVQNFLGKRGTRKFEGTVSQYRFDWVIDLLDTLNLLPAIFFLTSRAECDRALASCFSRGHGGKHEEGEALTSRLDKLLRDMPFLKDHRQLPHLVSARVAAHHGGQLPHWKLLVEKLMDEGYLRAMFSTSTVAAGVNFPARTVALVQSDRFNGKEFVELTAMELHQMTGRAGRRGKDMIGFALVLPGRFQNPHLIDDLLCSPSEPVESQITINFSMVLNLLLSHTPEEIRKVFELSFATFQSLKENKNLKEQRGHLLQRIGEQCGKTPCGDPVTLVDLMRRRWEMLKTRGRLNKCLKANTDRSRGMSRGQEQEMHSLRAQAKALKEDLKALPCNGCSHFAPCFGRRGRTFQSLVKEAQVLTSKLDAVKDRLWHAFQKHLTFLKETGFATEDSHLTPDGMWASQLRLDQPLMIAEAIRRGLFESLSPQLLAGTIAPFVNDKLREVELSSEASFDRRPIRGACRVIRSNLQPLWQLKKAGGFESPPFQFWPAAAIYAWAMGMEWEEVIRFVSADEGDMAMLIYRTADNLRQIASLEKTHPGLASNAKQAVSLLFREPILVVR